MKKLTWKPVLGAWWASRSPSERQLMVAVALCLGLLMYGWLLLSTTQARAKLLPAVVRLQAQAGRQDRQAAEITRLRAAPASASTTADLRQLVQRQVGASGLGQSLASMEQMDADHVKLVFGHVAFARWLAWADDMRTQHLRFSRVRIESQDTPGQVSVSATVERSHR